MTEKTVNVGDVFKTDRKKYALIWDIQKDDEGCECCYVINFGIYWDSSNINENSKREDWTNFAEFESMNKPYKDQAIEWYSSELVTLNSKQFDAVCELLKGLHFDIDYLKSIVSPNDAIAAQK